MGIPLQKGTIETMLNVGKIYEIQCFEYKLQTERAFFSVGINLKFLFCFRNFSGKGLFPPTFKNLRLFNLDFFYSCQNLC